MAYLLDTNVISELVKASPAGSVLAWLRRQTPDELFLSAMTIGEIVRGVERLPAGRQRRALARWVERDLTDEFEGRVLPFDYEAAVLWGRLMGAADRAGRPRSAADGQIAATARRYGLTLATRNVRDFAGMGVDLINPWTAGKGEA